MKKKNKEKLFAGIMAALNGTTMLYPMAAFTAAVTVNYDAGVAEATTVASGSTPGLVARGCVVQRSWGLPYRHLAALALRR